MPRPEHIHPIHLKGVPEPDCVACKIERRDIREETARALLETCYDVELLLKGARWRLNTDRPEAELRLAKRLVKEGEP